MARGTFSPRNGSERLLVVLKNESTIHEWCPVFMPDSRNLHVWFTLHMPPFLKTASGEPQCNQEKSTLRGHFLHQLPWPIKSRAELHFLWIWRQLYLNGVVGSCRRCYAVGVLIMSKPEKQENDFNLLEKIMSLDVSAQKNPTGNWPQGRRHIFVFCVAFYLCSGCTLAVK